MKHAPLVLVAVLVLLVIAGCSARALNLNAISYSCPDGTRANDTINCAGANTSAELSAMERRAFDLVNERRASAGLAPLAWADDVARVARLHSVSMVKHGFFSHVDENGLLVNARVSNAGILWNAVGENLHENNGYDDPAGAAVAGWMASPTHRENILRQDYDEAGVGVARAGDGTYYFTQVFIKRIKLTLG